MSSSLTALVASLTLSVSPASDKTCFKNCTLSDQGVSFIQLFEGYSPVVYKDSAGLATIGYGHLIKKGEKFTEPMMPDAAAELLRKDAKEAMNGVNKYTKVKLKQNQADAVISFSFNVGVGAYAGSTLLKRINAERHDEVRPQFLKWNKARDPKTRVLVEVRGLTRRRSAEADLYEG